MVCDYYYPHVGGVAEHMRYLSAELRRRGHDVRILTARTPADGDTVWLPDEDKVRRIGRGVLVPTNGSYARLVVAADPVAQVRRYFREERFDVIHIHGSLAPTLPLCALHAAGADGDRPLTVFTFHAGHNRNAGYALFRPLLRRYFRRIDGPVAVSEAARWSTSLYFPGDYTIIPNGIDTNLFRPDVPVPAELADGRPRILFMGRIEPRKGLKYLLMALPEIVRRVPDVELLVVGTGLLGYSYRHYLSHEVEGRVRWVGLVPGEARPGYFAASRVFCSPAVGNESFGIVLLEAMASARPVVASDIAGYRTVMQDGIQGLFHAPCDPAALAAAVVRLLEDPALCQRMGAAGRERAAAFAWPAIAAGVEALYTELIERYPNPRLGR